MERPSRRSSEAIRNDACERPLENGRQPSADIFPITCLLALMAGWLLPFDAAVIWTLFVLGTIALPSFAPVLAATIVPRHASLSLSHHIRSIMADFRVACLQSMLIVAFLAHQAWLMSDAIIRTLFRLFITRHDLLEWTPAGQASIGRKPILLATIDGWPARSLWVWRPRGGLDLRRPDVAHRRAVWSFVVRFSGNCLLG